MATFPISDTVAFWNDENVSLTGVHLKTTVPDITPVDLKLPYFGGGHETLVYLALQIERTSNKEVAIQAIASAVGILFKQSRDLTGGTGKRQSLSGLDIPGEDIADKPPATVVGSEWRTGATITAGDIAAYLGDIDELGAYYGVLFLAGVKKRTAKNRDAFNKNRVGNVRSTVNQDLAIFVENSVLLSDDLLDTVYAAFNSFLANRMYLVRETVRLTASVYVGPALSFQNMFLLLEDTGLGSLRVVKEAVLKYPFIKRDFPELASELRSADQAQKAIRRVNESERPYCKAIYGNRFVPVDQREIVNLLGVCKNAMAYTVETYRNFDGGNLSEKQENLIRARLEASGVTTTPEEETE